MLNFGKTLVVAAHPDDEVLGCGGLIAKLINQGEQVRVVFIAEGTSCRYEALNKKVQEEINFRNQCSIEAMRSLGVSSHNFYNLPCGRLDKEPIIEIAKIIEKESKALARAEARNKVKKTGEKQMQNFALSQKELIVSQSITATLFVLIITALSIGWIAYLTFSNVANRSVEIGILGAMGFGGSKLILLIISRATLMGVAGTLCALLLSFLAVPIFWGEQVFNDIFMNPSNLFILTCVPTLLACCAAWIPAVKGALKDPAVILRNE